MMSCSNLEDEQTQPSDLSSMFKVLQVALKSHSSLHCPRDGQLDHILTEQIGKEKCNYSIYFIHF